MKDTIYVAGASSERFEVVRPAIDQLKEFGYEVTYDWTRHEGYDVPFTESMKRDAARTDLSAVKAARVFWYMAPESKSEGSHAELGAALVLDKITIVSGRHALELGRIFPSLAMYSFPEHTEALDFLRTRSWCTAEVELLEALSRCDGMTVSLSHAWSEAVTRLEEQGKVRVTRPHRGGNPWVKRI